MKVTVEGKYIAMVRKIKEAINYEIKITVPDGMTENELKSFLVKTKDSPLVKALKAEDKQFHSLSKFRFLDFKQTLPEGEELDTQESLDLDLNVEKKPSGKVTANSEFGNITEALADKPKKGK